MACLGPRWDVESCFDSVACLVGMDRRGWPSFQMTELAELVEGGPGLAWPSRRRALLHRPLKVKRGTTETSVLGLGRYRCSSDNRGSFSPSLSKRRESGKNQLKLACAALVL